MKFIGYWKATSLVLCCLYLELNAASEIVFIVLSQPSAFHEKQAVLAKNDIRRQSSKPVKIRLLHEDWLGVGGWTIFPVLNELHGSTASWVFFGEEGTRVRLHLLNELLGKFSTTEEWFLGRALRDQTATIIHHFAFHNDPTSFSYPNPYAGFLLSMPLVKRTVERWKSNRDAIPEFSIDPMHELALFIKDDGNGSLLVDVPELCVRDFDGCASYFTLSDIPQCNVLQNGDIFFAVKTCQKFHKDRAEVVKETWGKNLAALKFFSDVSDDSVPTINLGIPNTDRGHCAKTEAILEYVFNYQKNYSWIIIADDDTLLSVPRLRRLLTCYNPSDTIALGERYGYRTASQSGYDYITGGGGMVFSMATVELLVEHEHCSCPAINSPDDMHLGICLFRLGIPIIHSARFHQARPMDYPLGIQHVVPVSFHKHWMVNPHEIYKTWLESPGYHHMQHSEL